MVTLRIEHAVTDYQTWRAAFDRFAQLRERSGVSGHRILRPVDDPRFVVIDLDFPTTGQARDFLAFLKAQVWACADAAPALAGIPRTRILQPADAARRWGPDAEAPVRSPAGDHDL